MMKLKSKSALQVLDNRYLTVKRVYNVKKAHVNQQNVDFSDLVIDSRKGYSNRLDVKKKQIGRQSSTRRLSMSKDDINKCYGGCRTRSGTPDIIKQAFDLRKN